MQIESSGPVATGTLAESARTGAPIPKRGLVHNRNFVLLACAQGISNVGDFFFTTTLLVWIYDLTHQAGAVGSIWVAEYAPIFLLGPFAGVFVDRWNRRTTMLTADIARAALTLIPLLVAGALRLPAIYVSVFVLRAFSRFFMPAKAALLQAIVPEEQRGQAASVSQTMMAISFILGPAIATPLYSLFGPTLALTINALSFGVSALCVGLMRVPREQLHPYAYQAQEANSQQGLQLVLREFREGLTFVRKTRTLLVLIFMSLLTMLGAGALNSLDIVFVAQRLHSPTSLYGTLMAAGGVGVLVGAVVCGLLGKKITPKAMVSWGVMLLGIGLIAYSFQTIFLVAVILNFLICIPQAGLNIGFGPLIMGVTPGKMMGRVQSVLDTSMFGFSLLSATLASFLGQLVRVDILFGLCGGLIVLAGILSLFLLPAHEGQPETAMVAENAGDLHP